MKLSQTLIKITNVKNGGDSLSTWLNLENKVVIVTGGSSGIGKAIVQELAEQSAQVIVADVNEIDSTSENVYFKETDVSSRESVEAMTEWVYQKFGKINSLVNNAGINLPRLLVDSSDPDGIYEISDKDFQKLSDVNQKGVVLVSQCVAKYMIEKKDGVILNMSSESGLEGSEGQSLYAATKAAINSYTRSWAKELGKYGIRVVGVAPGIMEKTALRTLEYEKALAHTRGVTVDVLRDGYTNTSIPIGRDGKLSEVANAVAFFISDRASYITGITCNVAGGKTRG